MAVPVRPLPELQWTIIIFSGSSTREQSVSRGVTFEPLVAAGGHLEDEVERGTVVVRPVVVRDLAVEVLLLVVGGPLTSIDDPVVPPVLPVEEGRNLTNYITRRSLPFQSGCGTSTRTRSRGTTSR